MKTGISGEDEINDGAVFFSLLYMPKLQICQLTPAQSASKQDGEDGPVMFAFE